MMKRLIFGTVLILGIGVLCKSVKSEELRPQFRVWKSSYLQGGNYSNVLISSSPIIFHVLQGSQTTTSSGGNNYFVLLRSTINPPAVNMSTKAFIYTNQTAAERSGLGIPWDVFSDSYTFFGKQGGAILFYEWDYYKTAPYDQFPKD